MQAGEVAVEHDDVVGVEVEFGGAGESVVGDVDGHALVAQPLGDQVRELRLVLDDQNPHAGTGVAVGVGMAAGSVICTRRPPCGRAWSSSSPPCASATAATIDRPSP